MPVCISSSQFFQSEFISWNSSSSFISSLTDMHLFPHLFYSVNNLNQISSRYVLLCLWRIHCESSLLCLWRIYCESSEAYSNQRFRKFSSYTSTIQWSVRKSYRFHILSVKRTQLAWVNRTITGKIPCLSPFLWYENTI